MRLVKGGWIWEDGPLGRPADPLPPTAAPLSTAPSVRDTAEAPLAYTLPYLTERILASRAALEDERKQVTVLFADLNGWLVLQAGSVSYGQATVEARYGAAMPLADELGMRPLQAHCHCGLGTLYATTGQPEHARAELSIAIELYRTMEMSFWLPQAEAALARVEGR